MALAIGMVSTTGAESLSLGFQPVTKTGAALSLSSGWNREGPNRPAQWDYSPGWLISPARTDIVRACRVAAQNRRANTAMAAPSQQTPGQPAVA
jgi:hypothetical protein